MTVTLLNPGNLPALEFQTDLGKRYLVAGGLEIHDNDPNLEELLAREALLRLLHRSGWCAEHFQEAVEKADYIIELAGYIGARNALTLYIKPIGVVARILMAERLRQV